jgi:NosR/NirI family transcriptional regulator, nitrous oxide reductase regulator
MWGWLAISLVQTFVIIPLIVWKWGKGAYCGWLCSCGALAETLGDAQRGKMPHGPFWNRMNMVGQVILAAALILLVARILGWIFPGSVFTSFFDGLLNGWNVFGLPLNYYFWVDIFLAGIVGVGLYFWFSGRVWCRFACPLAALMHIYARFSRFRIFAEKSKCISCNVCTATCHQGIDVMSVANKGLPMEDPECVRCSACVQQCPTGVLTFGELLPGGLRKLDRLAASPVQMREAAKSHASV